MIRLPRIQFSSDHAVDDVETTDAWSFDQRKLLVSDAYRLSGQLASAISELMAIQQYVKKFVEIANERALSEARERARHEGDD